MRCMAGKTTRAARLGAVASKVLTCAAAQPRAGTVPSAAAPTCAGAGLETSAGGASQG